MNPHTGEVSPVFSRGPLRAVSFLWRAGDGRRVLTLVCKATYVLCPEVSPLAQAQDDIHTGDLHDQGGQDDAERSLKAPSDIVPFKRRADILVTGHAYAPPGPPVRSLSVRFVIGAVNKTFTVHAEQAFLLAPAWPDRSSKSGHRGGLWAPRDWRAHPLPDDMDASAFNCASPDQQADQIAPDERILLEHLHPEHERLVTRLEGVVPRAVFRWPQRPERPVALRCDTLWIDADRGVCCVTWRGSIPWEAAEGAEIHVTAEGRRLAPPVAGSTAWLDETGATPALQRGAGTLPGRAPDSATETIMAGLVAPVQTSPLPFVPAAPGAVPSVASSAESRERRAPDADATDTLVAPLLVHTKALPFEPAVPGIDLSAFTIERWAEVVAEIDKALRPEAEVLRAHDLTPRDFAVVERHFRDALDSEVASGGFSLRSRFDAAYVSALERLRGRPLSASEYAQLLVAAERRQLSAALRDLEMPAAAHLPIVRRWTGKLAREPKLASEMIEAVAALREGATGPGSALT